MAIELSFINIMQFFTLLSQILISIFLLLQSAVNADMKGIVWMIGSIVSQAFALGIKQMFFSQDKKKIERNEEPIWQRKLYTLAGTKAGESKIGNYCPSVFQGPFQHTGINDTSMPSLVAVFHAFTLTYLILGLSSNPNPNPGGILFVIILLTVAAINLFFRVNLACDIPLDIFAGGIIGIGFGFAWFYLALVTNPTWTYYGKEDQKGKCVLGKQKFKCSYD
jgi:hypothetical protein